MKLILFFICFSSFIFPQNWEQQLVFPGQIISHHDIISYNDSILFMKSMSGYYRSTDKFKSYEEIKIWGYMVIRNDVIFINQLEKVYKSIDSGKTFHLINSTEYRPSVILDSLNWWSNSSSLRRTTNGGRNWELVSYIELKSIYFNDTIYGLGVNDKPYLWETSDGGRTWKNREIGYNLSNSSFIILDGDIFLFTNQLANGKFIVLNSSDKGSTWKELQLSYSFITKKDSIIINYDYNKSFSVSTNYGATWEEKYFPLIHVSVGIFDNNELFITNGHYNLFSSSNLGDTWEHSPNTSYQYAFYDFYFLNENTGWLYGDGILKTEDGGSSWKPYTFNYFDYIIDLTFINKDTGFAIVEGKNYEHFIYKSIDGGISWEKLFPTRPLEKIYFSNEKNGFAVGYGYIFTKDGGITWDTTNPHNIIGQDIHFTSNKYGFIVGYEKGYRSNDGGNDWFETMDLKGSNVFFVDSLIGYKAQYSGLFKSTDGGSSFTTLIDHQAPDYFSDIRFFNENEGIVYFNIHDDILRTKDGGNNWETLFHSNSSSNQIFFVSPYKGWLLTDYGIYKYEDTTVSFIADQNDLHLEYMLEQNYPNPFNPSTIINYSLPEASNVSIKVYDILGNEVAELVNEYKQVGRFSVTFNASNLASGLYIYKIQAGSFTNSHKMILIK